MNATEAYMYASLRELRAGQWVLVPRGRERHMRTTLTGDMFDDRVRVVDQVTETHVVIGIRALHAYETIIMPVPDEVIRTVSVFESCVGVRPGMRYVIAMMYWDPKEFARITHMDADICKNPTWLIAALIATAPRTPFVFAACVVTIAYCMDALYFINLILLARMFM